MMTRINRNIYFSFKICCSSDRLLHNLNLYVLRQRTFSAFNLNKRNDRLFMNSDLSIPRCKDLTEANYLVY